MSSKVQLPKNVYNAMKHLENTFGIDFLFKYEYLIGHYRISNKYYGLDLTSITEVVRFVKSSDENRKKYFHALVNGYEEKLTPEELLLQRYRNPDKYLLTSFNNEQIHIYQTGIFDTLQLLNLEVKGINK